MSIKLKDTIYDLINKASKDSSGNTITSTYLKLSGGTLTGILTITDNQYIGSTTSSAFLAVGDNSVFTGATNNLSTIFGSISLPAILRSSANNLTHYRSDKSTNYIILDAFNYTDYAATKDHTHSGYAASSHSHSNYVDLSTVQTISGKKTFSNGLAITGGATENTSLPFFIGIEAYSDGGTVKYISREKVLSCIGAASSGHTHNNYASKANIVFTPANGELTAANVLSHTGGFSIAKGTWNYAGNGYIKAGSFGNIDLAGCSILTFGSDSVFTQLYITASTQSGHSGLTNEMFFYNDHGSDYSPGWTRILTDRNYGSYCSAKSHTHSYASKVTVGSTAYNVSSNNITIPAYPTALACPAALTIQLNGTSQGAWDGSAAKTINITYSSVGAAAASHTHSYAATNHTHTTIVGNYTSNGGKQNPNYFGVNRVGALMMNTVVNGNSHYKDWLFMDCYSGSDVGGGVAIGINRQALGVYIMRSAATRTSWAESAELLGTHNWSTYCAAANHTHNYAAASHTHSYIPLSGGTLSSGTARISRAGSSTSWYLGRSNAMMYISSYSGYNAIASMKTTNGDWSIGVYTNNYMYFTYITDANYNSGTNTTTCQFIFRPDGYIQGNLSGYATSAGNADTVDSHHFSTVSALPSSPNANTVYFIV